MHVLIVDDEPHSQITLRSILAGRREVEGLDTARDAVEAFDKLMHRSFDVLLLDISMPEVSGIQLLDQLTAQGRLLPSVVFVTAYQQHALAAFDKHVVDYVLKPFSNERIEEALDIVFRRSAAERAVRSVEALPPPQTLTPRKREKIAIKANGKILFIAPDDVVAVHAEGNYVLLETDTGSYLLRVSISSIAEKLRPYGFLRIHRSALVNASFVEELQPLPTGEYMLRIKGGREYTVTRTYKSNLKGLAGCWIGFDGFEG
ncbi:MAG: LytTR family DNA-binding domain-containing protein [Acidobacteriaceae bacterium]|jgi:two-component system LytT family response regulator